MSASYHSSDCKILPLGGDEDISTSETEDQGPRLQIINAHFQVSCHQSLDLQRLNEFVKKGKLFQGRPTMLSCRLQKESAFLPNWKDTNSRWRINSTSSEEGEVQTIIDS